MMSTDRTAEIWSTRLQRELLALSESSQQQPPPTTTTPKETDINNEEENSSKEDDNNKEVTKQKKVSKANADIALLPPFIKFNNHILEIEQGICKVSFDIDVCPKKKEEEEKKKEEDEDEDGKDDTTTTTVASTEDGEVGTVVTDMPTIVSITLDVSLERNSEGEPIANPNTYPFQKPKAILTNGEELFPPNSDICNGDYLEVDCDWTPSLHLSDAALNVSLKIRECIRKGFPFRKSEIAGELDDGEDDEDRDTILSRIMGNISSVAAAASAQLQQQNTESEGLSSPRQQQQQHLGIIHIGDEVNLNEEPFSLCAGMFTVKPIRRPDFMEAEITQSAVRRQQLTAASGNMTSTMGVPTFEEDADENEIPSGLGSYMMLQAGGIKKVAGAGFSGAGSMFKSIVKSTTKVLEESYLMITDDFLIELRATKFNAGSATVSYIIPISLLAKLKFRRNESLSLFFKQAHDDPYILMCPDSYDAVQQIQSMLQRYGVKGKHTNSTTQRLIQEAMMIIYQVQTKEKTLEASTTTATVEAVKDIMNLYRQAAELFESANDPRHEEVMTHMREFLAKPLVLALLDTDENSQTASTPTPNTASTTATTSTTTDEEEDLRSTADILKDADDIFNDDDDDINVDDLLNNNDDSEDNTTADDGDDMVDIDAMLTAADKELDEIIKS